MIIFQLIKVRKYAKKKYPNIKLIQNDENFGYCEGNNIGIRKARGDFIMILNPDTIVEPNCIRELIFAHEKLGEGLYQPKILSLNEKQVLQSTGNMIHVFGFGFAKDKGKKDEEVGEEIKKLVMHQEHVCLLQKVFRESRIIRFFFILVS